MRSVFRFVVLGCVCLALCPFLESFFLLRGVFGKFSGAKCFVLVVCGCVVSFGVVFASDFGFIGTASLLKIA